jgi:transposase
MADQGKRIDERTQKYLAKLREVLSVRDAAKQANVNKSTVQKYTGRKSA